MYDYILRELPDVVMNHFPATARKSISGHSMGGLGALVLALRNPGEYVSVSAFSPIVSPSQVPWGNRHLALTWVKTEKRGKPTIQSASFYRVKNYQKSSLIRG